MAAVLLFPILVQVNQHVEPAVELQLRMDVEVGVDLEKPARLDLMQPPTTKVGIRDQPLDSGERFEPQQRLEGVQIVEKIANCFRERASLVRVSELLFLRIVELHPLHGPRVGKVAQDRFEDVRVEESVQDNVRKRRSRGVLRAERGSVMVKSQRRHEKSGRFTKSSLISGEYVTQRCGDA